jgi:hypothetical protein
MKKDEYNPYLNAAILEAVDNQIRDNEPPETRQTRDRLVQEGYTEDEARQLILTAVVVEIFHVLKFNEKFNRERFVKNLNNLPNEPWES